MKQKEEVSSARKDEIKLIIEDWKKGGYDVSELEKVLLEARGFVNAEAGTHGTGTVPQIDDDERSGGGSRATRDSSSCEPPP